MADLIYRAMRAAFAGGSKLAKQIVISAVASVCAALAVPSLVATYRQPAVVQAPPAPLMVAHQDLDAAFVMPGPGATRALQPEQRAAAGLAEAMVAEARSATRAVQAEARRATGPQVIRRAAAAPLPPQRPQVVAASSAPAAPLDLAALRRPEPEPTRVLGMTMPRLDAMTGPVTRTVSQTWTSAKDMVAGVFR
jgi:hypothetical protein